MAETSSSFLVIPTTEAPAQSIPITLGGQSCLVNLYAKSTNVPRAPSGNQPQPTPPAPPLYENVNPVFIDLYVGAGATLIIGGVQVARSGGLIVRDVYLGFVGDLAVYDVAPPPGEAPGVPLGVSPRLPPYDLRSEVQIATYPLSNGDLAPAYLAGRIPGMGSRFVLTYWPPGTYVPGYSLPA